MIFWIIAGLITLATIGVTIYSAIGSGFGTKIGEAQTHDSPLDYDKEIYKARLKEIDEELATGLINNNEYDNAIAEEGRRFLALASSASKTPGANDLTDGKSGEPRTPLNPAIIGAVFALILIPLISLPVYYKLGSVDMPDHPLKARLDADPKGQSIGILLQRAENQLIKKPDDGRGWLVVAPVYMRLNRPGDAATAYRNAIRILGASAELQTSLGEALTVAAGGVISEEADELFRKAAASDPDNAKPLFFLGIGLNQAGEYEKAAILWKNLIDKSPEDASWLGLARKQLELAQISLGVKLPDNSSASAPGNPDAEDVKAAGQLSSAERQEFINSMVERLAEELQENPQNKPGWQRIIRSYTVLGRKSDALAAIKTAQQLFKDDSEFIIELEQNRAALNK